MRRIVCELMKFHEELRADLVIMGLKSVEIFTHIRFANKKQGLLINFSEAG